MMKFLWRLIVTAVVLPIFAACIAILWSPTLATTVANTASDYLKDNPESDLLGLRQVLPFTASPGPAGSSTAVKPTVRQERVVAAQVWHHTAINAGQTSVTFANESPSDAWSDCTVTLAGGYRGGPFQLPPLGRAELRPDAFRTPSGQALPAASGALMTAGALTLRCTASDGRPAVITTR
jgi:hypothetical protein